MYVCTQGMPPMSTGTCGSQEKAGTGLPEAGAGAIDGC